MSAEYIQVLTTVDSAEEAERISTLAKTEASRYAEVEAAIREAHSYEEPEILAIPVLAGSAGYLGWISDNVDG